MSKPLYRLAQERTALLDLIVRPWPGGGFLARLPWRREGYPGGTFDGDDTGCTWYHFAGRGEAEAAVWLAAGITREDSGS